MDDHHRSAVRLSEFSTTDVGEAEDFLDSCYSTGSTLTINGVVEDFGLAHSSVGTRHLSINDMQIGIDLTNDSHTRPDEPVTAIQVLDGCLAFTDTRYPEGRAGTGDVLMRPFAGSARSIAEPVILLVAQLDRPSLVQYAATMSGIDPGQLAFDSITPLTPTLGRYWIEAMTHVRNDVLDSPEVANHPILLDQAFRTLASALLSTFPNTALARVTDPQGPPVLTMGSAATLRDVTDYIDQHADQPVGPEHIARLVDAPYPEIVRSLRRRYGVHPAELLWHARLRGVRRDLLDTDGSPGSTPDGLAAGWGFAHRGRFRAAYRQAFAEWPEDTLFR